MANHQVSQELCHRTKYTFNVLQHVLNVMQCNILQRSHARTHTRTHTHARTHAHTHTHTECKNTDFVHP